MRFYNPWPEPYTINARSPWGPRRHPITRKQSFHHGIDVAMPIGTPLIAGADGTVAHKGNGASGGHVLILRHAGNFHTVYYHLKEASHKRLGEPVKAGDIVAMSGNTGRSTGPHLHFEVRRSRKWGDTIDPQPLLQGPFRGRPEAPTRPQRPSRVGRVSPGLEGLSRSWVARGAHAIRRGLGR
jgi:murein DD-endopeptidase MepM/ murein hydrolase activator NlpD